MLFNVVPAMYVAQGERNFDLTDMNLNRTGIHDDWLQYETFLKFCQTQQKLKSFSLVGNFLTDAAVPSLIKALQGLVKLKLVSLWDTKITENGRARLESALQERTPTVCVFIDKNAAQEKFPKKSKK